jgi:hypothetical protein
MKLSLAANLMLNRVCPVLSFPEHFQPFIAAMCTVAINVLEPDSSNPKSQYFIPYLIKFHDFADNSQERMKHQMRGATHTLSTWDFPAELSRNAGWGNDDVVAERWG